MTDRVENKLHRGCIMGEELRAADTGKSLQNKKG